MESYKIVQIGCGVVGKAYVDAYKKVGCHVIGIEASNNLIEKYGQEFEIYHKDDLDNIKSIKDVDFVMISINTPLKGTKLDLSYLFSSISTVAEIVNNSSENIMVIIRSTVPPRTTQRYKNKLEEIVKKNVNVLFQPEFLRAESAFKDALNPWHVVFGCHDNLDVSRLVDLYSKFINRENITVMNIETAEIFKVFHNSYNAAKISFTNQSNLLCQAINKKDNTNIDCDVIMKTIVKTCEGYINPKYGTKPGHAYYGTCLPKDSAELASLESEYGLNTHLFQSIVDVNNEVKRNDKEEILAADYHMDYDNMTRH